MRCLVVVPTNLFAESFSAPQAWLYSGHVDRVRGVYDRELTPELVRNHDTFIVELNWFPQLRIFFLVVAFIRRYNPGAKILFGGLYAGLMCEEIFRRLPVDYFIRGDTELPIREFLQGVAPRKIPNMVGRDFENPQIYKFALEEFEHLDYNLDWFPSYHTELAKVLAVPAQESYAAHIPRYPLPMLFTTKGGCLSFHSGCDYCLGMKQAELKKLYGRGIVLLDNATLIRQLRKVERRFDAATLFFLSDPAQYDFSGLHFDIDATIEFDSKATVTDVARIMPAFRSANVHLALYEEGLTGSQVKQDLGALRDLEDDQHRIYYFGFQADADATRIPNDRRLYSELVLPKHTRYESYVHFDAALAVSDFYFMADNRRSFFLVEPLGKRLRTWARHVAWRAAVKLRERQYEDRNDVSIKYVVSKIDAVLERNLPPEAREALLRTAET